MASLAPGPAAPQRLPADILFTLTAENAVLTTDALTLAPVAALATYYTASGASGMYSTGALSDAAPEQLLQLPGPCMPCQLLPRSSPRHHRYPYLACCHGFCPMHGVAGVYATGAVACTHCLPCLQRCTSGIVAYACFEVNYEHYIEQ